MDSSANPTTFQLGSGNKVNPIAAWTQADVDRYVNVLDAFLANLF